MTWLIIILILIVVIGPVMYLVPTASDRRLSSLRTTARQCGLNVRITSVPKLDPASHERVTAGGKQLDPRTACAAYHLPMGDNGVEPGGFMLLKLPRHPTVPVNEVIAGWGLSKESDARFWQRYTQRGNGTTCLSNTLKRLPEDTLALALDHRSVACYWQEKAAVQEGVVECIAQALTELRDDARARI